MTVTRWEHQQDAASFLPTCLSSILLFVSFSSIFIFPPRLVFSALLSFYQPVNEVGLLQIIRAATVCVWVCLRLHVCACIYVFTWSGLCVCVGWSLLMWDLQYKRVNVGQTDFLPLYVCLYSLRWSELQYVGSDFSLSVSPSLLLHRFLISPFQPFLLLLLLLMLLSDRPIFLSPIMPSLLLLSLSLLSSNWNWQLWRSWHKLGTGSWGERN